jgi:glycerol-3-phosphate O-acyltransferase
LQGHREDPFLSLVSLAQRSRRPVYLVPELFVWKARSASIRPTLWDRIFGSSEAPGFLHSILAFWRNRNRAQFRVGEPIDLTQFLAANPHDTDARLARR